MDKLRELGELLNGVAKKGIQTTLVAAEVVAITGESCTVKVGDMQLTDVRLKASINGEANKILLLPKVGTKVLLGSLTGDLRDLCILKIDEIEHVIYNHGNTSITINAQNDAIELNAAGTVLGLANTVTIENTIYNLLDLILEFIDICANEIHMTNAGPTVSLNPATKLKFSALQQKFLQLLS